MTSRVTLICAASTEALARGAFPQDEPLEPRGSAKAAALGPRLRWSERILAGPALRARQTAQALGFSPAIDPLLDDCDFGKWRGRHLADIHSEDPEGVASWIADPASAPHGGESILDLLQRAARWLEADRGDAGHIIAVTHPGFIRAAVLHVIGAPAPCFWRIDIEPLSLTDLRSANNRWTLRSCGNPMDD